MRRVVAHGGHVETFFYIFLCHCCSSYALLTLLGSCSFCFAMCTHDEYRMQNDFLPLFWLNCFGVSYSKQGLSRQTINE